MWLFLHDWLISVISGYHNIIVISEKQRHKAPIIMRDAGKIFKQFCEFK